MMSIANNKFSRYMWLIPLVMLAIAMLACDEVYVPPPMIGQVEVDPAVQGKVYITVVNAGATYNNGSLDSGHTVAYESSDFGTNWNHSEHKFAAKQINAYAMTMYGETLSFNTATWNFPRPMFRTVFYDESGFASMRFELPDGFVANAAQGDQVYIAMGTEGVLVAKLAGNGFAPDWRLSTTGIDSLTPLPLIVTEPTTLMGIILLILCVPPFALIHAYLLQRVWVYVLPPAEARRLALWVTAGLVLLAIIGSLVWLTSDRIDLYEVIGVLTIITVIIGMTVTVLLALKAEVTSATRNRLAIASILVSLIVPGGVAAIFAMWWLVFGVVLSYWAYHRAYWRYIAYAGVTPEGRVQRWRVDRLAIEMVIICMVGASALFAQVTFFQAFTYRFGGLGSLVFLLGIGLAIAGLYFVIRHYSRRRAQAILQLNMDVPQTRDLQHLSRDLWRHTLYWGVLAIVLSIATFIGQMMAYSWFTSLLIIKQVL